MFVHSLRPFGLHSHCAGAYDSDVIHCILRTRVIIPMLKIESVTLTTNFTRNANSNSFETIVSSRVPLDRISF